MKTLTLFSALLLLGLSAALAENARYVTVICTNWNYPAQIQIAQGETAEIVDAHTSYNVTLPSLISVGLQKDGAALRGYPPGFQYGSGSSLLPRGTIVTGPASFILDTPSAMLSVKIIPEAYDPNKTLILPPGTNRVFITLESSTNLVTWADATNGFYGSPDLARFFRIRMDKPAAP